MTPAQRVALKSLARIWPNRRITVVGATALVLRQRLPPDRATLDIDLAVDVDADELRTRLRLAPDWSPGARREHRWHHERGAIVDLLPIGGEALETGVLVWPGTGARMNLEGFQLLNQHSGQVAGLDVQAAGPTLIALLKMVAWLDRPNERAKDLQDLAFLMDEYVEPTDDRMFTGEAAAIGLFDERANTYLLGLDMGQMVATSSGDAVGRFLRRMRGDGSAQVAFVQRWRSVDDEPALLDRLDLFERGFSMGRGTP